MSLDLVESLEGSDGVSAKSLWRTGDSLTIETGYFRYLEYDTVCVSSQAGCNIGCRFCATGLERVRRSLRAEEIVEQVMRAPADFFNDSRRFKVSFQGMGEPLQNLDEVLAAIAQIRLQLERAEFGVSTVGPASAIQRLVATEPQIKLQLSLHAAQPAKRKLLIPGVAAGQLSASLAVARRHAESNGRRVVLNYLLLSGVNDSLDDAHALVQLLGADTWYELKLSQFNPSAELPFESSSPGATAAFLRELHLCGIAPSRFVSFGRDIDSGCGQLRTR